MRPALLVLFVLAACADDEPTPSLGRDAAPSDARAADASLSSDAAPAGDAEADAGALLDAASSGDAEPGPDGGPARDAGNRCARSSDCIPGAELCSALVLEGGAPVSRCGPPNASGPMTPIGGRCAADADCGSGLCLEDLTSECSVVCSDAESDCPAGFACVGYEHEPGMVSIPVCNRRCADQDDCPFGACSVHGFRDALGALEVVTVCQNLAGTVPLGGACAGPGDCQSGLCVTSARVGVGCGACVATEVCMGDDCVIQACTAVCDEASDCAGGAPLTRCSSVVNVNLPDGTTQQVSACARP